LECRDDIPWPALDEASLNEKDLAWLPFFELKHLAPSSQAHKRLGHHFTTDGVSVSVVILQRKKDGQGVAKKNNKNKRAKRSEQPHNIASDAPLPARHVTTPVDTAKVVGCDPGKHELLHLTNEASPLTAEGRKTLGYTFKQRLHESGAKARNKRLNKRRNEEVKQAEVELTKFNSRTTSFDLYKQYLGARFRVQDVLYAHYSKAIHRITRWHNFRDRRSSEDLFCQRVVATFGRDAIIAYGDRSRVARIARLAGISYHWLGKASPRQAAPRLASGRRARTLHHADLLKVRPAHLRA
jgi:hypothetical protein